MPKKKIAAPTTNTDTENDITVLTCRNPWAFLIINDQKRLENREKPVPSKWINKWIALHVSKSWTPYDIDMSCSVISEANVEADDTYDKLSKMRTILDTMSKQTTHIIGFIKIDACYPVADAPHDFRDNTWFQYPSTTKFVWHISDTYALEESQYIKFVGNTGFIRIKDKRKKKKVMKLIKKIGK